MVVQVRKHKLARDCFLDREWEGSSARKVHVRPVVNDPARLVAGLVDVVEVVADDGFADQVLAKAK